MNTDHAPLFIGLALSVVLWQIMSLFDKVPTENRGYRDAPAIGFRMLWPFIRLVVFYASQFISTHTQDSLQKTLAKAGAEYSLSFEELWASRWVSAAVFSVLLFWVCYQYSASLIMLLPIVAMVGYRYPEKWLTYKAKLRVEAVLKALPFYLDVITLSVEAGSNLTGGITQAVQRTPDSELRRELGRVLRDIRSGKTRADALRAFAQRVDSITLNQVISGLIQGEKAGANLGPMLRAQSEQLRTERFQRAEKKAMEAPVKLLAPLFLCIFPMTFVALGFVMLSKAIIEGFISSPWLLWAYTWPG